MTDGNDKPNYIPLAGTLSYQEFEYRNLIETIDIIVKYM